MTLLIKSNASVDVSVDELAAMFWELGSDEQAFFFQSLSESVNNNHLLMMQSLSIRDGCEKLRKEGYPEALEAFQMMFSAAYKYMGDC